MPASFGGPTGKGFRAVPQKGENVCNYCREAGHWKSDCPMPRSREQHAGGGYVKPVALAASFLGPRVTQTCQTEREKSGLPARPVDESYLPFISDGFVTKVGSDVEVHQC